LHLPCRERVLLRSDSGIEALMHLAARTASKVGCCRASKILSFVAPWMK